MTFRLVLQSEFDKRRRQNRRYSLRAFARRLGTDHATLSQLLRGRRVLTRRNVRQFAECLGIAGRDYEIEVALLALTRRVTFRADVRALADRIGVTTDQVNIALQRLLRSGVITMGGQEWQTESRSGRS